MTQEPGFAASRTYDWIFKPEDAAFITRFITEVLLPNSEKIRKISSGGGIPIVLFEPLPEMQHIFGGTHGQVLSMNHAQRQALRTDPHEIVTKKWLDRKDPRGMAKVFAVMHRSTFLFNWVSGYELYIQDGSLDAEWKA